MNAPNGGNTFYQAMHWFLCSRRTDFHCITVMQLLWNSLLWDYGVGQYGYFYSLMRKQSFSSLFFQTEEDYIPYPSVHEVGWWNAAVALFHFSFISACVLLRSQFNFILVLKLLSRLRNSSLPSLFDILGQVLGRKSPFPLILLPQFGGYWIEGTNHELSDVVDTEQLQPLSPNTRTKLECNTTATIYRKHFLGKVSHFVILRVVCDVPQIASHCWLVKLIPRSPS